jgi:hypothetical protein
MNKFASIGRGSSASALLAFLPACVALALFAPPALAQRTGGPGQSRGQTAQVQPEGGSSPQSASEAASEAEAEAQFEAELEEAEIEEAGGSPTSPSTRTSHSSNTASTEAAGAHAVVSGLRLTHQTVAALSSRRVQAAQVHFAFTLSAQAALHVSLQQESIRGGQVSWQTLPDSMVMVGKRGANADQLRAHSSLAGGFYRLTVTAPHSAGKSVYLRVP